MKIFVSYALWLLTKKDVAFHHNHFHFLTLRHVCILCIMLHIWRNLHAHPPQYELTITLIQTMFKCIMKFRQPFPIKPVNCSSIWEFALMNISFMTRTEIWWSMTTLFVGHFLLVEMISSSIRRKFDLQTYPLNTNVCLQMLFQSFWSTEKFSLFSK